MTFPPVRTRKRVKPTYLPTLTPDPAPADFSCNGLRGDCHDNLRLLVRYAPIGEIKPPARTLRKHSDRQLKQIEVSIREHGFVNPILIGSDSRVVSGHARLLAATSLGMTLVPVIALEHLTPEQLRLYAIADNRIAEQSEFDIDALTIEFEELDLLDLNLELTGFTTSQIDDMLVGAEGEAPGAGADEPQAMAITQPGDLWLLGNHRLFCGNSLEPASFEILMPGEKAQIVFADSPYNLPAKAFSSSGKHKHSDFAMAAGELSKTGFVDFLATSFRRLVENSADGSIHYQCMDWRHMGEMLAAGEQEYTELKNLVVWAKQSAGMGTFYRSQHELVFVWKNGTAPHVNNFGLGDTGRHRSNVWSYKGNSGFHRNRDAELASHPTVKNWSMVADALRDCSKRGDIVLDPFGGAGTTAIAAERTGRKARLIELDPLYCDVTIRRWEELTGQEAMLAATGQSFADVATGRGVVLDDGNAGTADDGNNVENEGEGNLNDDFDAASEDDGHGIDDLDDGEDA
jgi:DNA modification methylase